MKKIIVSMVLFFVVTFVRFIWAHHTKDHMMLMENSEHVIAATQQGIGEPWVWLIWFCVVCLFVFGFWQWQKKK